MIEEGKSVILDDGKKRFLLRVEDMEEKIKGIGRFNPAMLKECSFGEVITIGSKDFMILEPSISDMMLGIRRKAQIITPKDACHIILYTSIHDGSLVIEAGSGSGALTMALAHSIAPDGRVVSYDVREDFLEVARENVRLSGYRNVEFRLGDVRERINEHGADAVVFDFSDPWNAVENAYEALKDFGHLCCYCPTVEQIERCASVMERSGFTDIRTIEVIEREMVIREGSSRPDNARIGHTAYMCFARKLPKRL